MISCCLLFVADMEKEEKNQKGFKAPETELFLQWGNRKRLRGARVKDPEISDRSSGGFRRKITSRIERCVVTASEKENSHLQPTRFTRNSDAATLRSNGGENRRSSSSPEKEDRYYTTRGSVGVADDNGRNGVDGGGGGGGEERGLVWPKLYITLSSKEKEEDFMAMKGCKLPQRPKKRAKLIQRSLLLVSPGAWLSDMCQERYEVREKKSSKKVLLINKKSLFVGFLMQRPRGLKAMGSMESDSE
ncbi:hypothetical protein L1049_009162 [Liquidambar formosana]|uniref:Uncharacterized protein n=1 Tax=Liquidambar formosana TaxID=63359 RepID=A0AAP0X9T2_LIQFO